MNHESLTGDADDTFDLGPVVNTDAIEVTAQRVSDNETYIVVTAIHSREPKEGESSPSKATGEQSEFHASPETLGPPKTPDTETIRRIAAQKGMDLSDDEPDYVVADSPVAKIAAVDKPRKERLRHPETGNFISKEDLEAYEAAKRAEAAGIASELPEDPSSEIPEQVTWGPPQADDVVQTAVRSTGDEMEPEARSDEDDDIDVWGVVGLNPEGNRTDSASTNGKDSSAQEAVFVLDGETWDESNPTEVIPAMHGEDFIKEEKIGTRPIVVRERKTQGVLIGIGVVAAATIFGLWASIRDKEDLSETPPPVVTEFEQPEFVAVDEGNCHTPDLMTNPDETELLQEFLQNNTIKYGETAGQPYYTGETSGIYDDATKFSVSVFQADAAEDGYYPIDAIDGLAGDLTCPALGQYPGGDVFYS